MLVTIRQRGLSRSALLAAPLVAVLGLGLGGCDFDPTGLFAEKYKPEVVPDVPADKLYSEGLAKMEDSDYEAAVKKFDNLNKQYQYSEWGRKALLMTAYANYQGQKYDDAINASKLYLQRHPSSKDAAYAQYLIAMSNYKQIPDVTRDQERSEKALVALQELAQRYPTSEYAADAKAKIQITRDQLAGKEMEVGRYYLEKRNFPAAINRFRDVVSKYQTTRHAEEHPAGGAERRRRAGPQLPRFALVQGCPRAPGQQRPGAPGGEVLLPVAGVPLAHRAHRLGGVAGSPVRTHPARSLASGPFRSWGGRDHF
jgi:outer membrane protein assembly factor BamD